MPAVSRPEEAPSVPSSTLPVIRKHRFPVPKLRLQLNHLAHEGSSVFLSNIKGNEDMETQVQNVLNLLYLPTSARPATRSVTFILHPFPGVAYTTGIDLDDDHKEIHLNLDYVKSVAEAGKEPRDELLGVICHELVHCFQWAAHGTCPGGLIEGVADWVRLRAGLAAKHWKQEADGKWDGGYQHTAYFLDYLEQRFGHGTVRGINEGLREGKYNEGKLFAQCCRGKKVGELWKEYGEDLKKEMPVREKARETNESAVIPTDTPPMSQSER